MKNILLGIAVLAVGSSNAQIKTPALSPHAKFEQTVGLTNITVEYSRPSARGRKVFPEVVAFDAVWRTGANKNTLLTTDNVLIFGQDTLQAGTYAIYTKPGAAAWSVYFYADTENWGTPDTWEASKIVLEANAKVNKVAKTETFTMGVDDVSINGASLSFTWDETQVKVPFTVATDSQVEANIATTLAGPTAGDYYRSADYYFNAKKDLKQALEWMDKSIAMQKDVPFYVLRKKSLIQAELQDFKGAIATAKLSLEKAKAAGNEDYIKMNEANIAEWSKK